MSHYHFQVFPPPFVRSVMAKQPNIHKSICTEGTKLFLLFFDGTIVKREQKRAVELKLESLSLIFFRHRPGFAFY